MQSTAAIILMIPTLATLLLIVGIIMMQDRAV